MTGLHVRIDEKRYGGLNGAQGHIAVRGLDMSVSKGAFTCIAGPSGSGKTTTLNIIAGLDPHFQGSVHFDDPGARDRLAYVFQEPRLLPWRTLLENVALPLGRAQDALPVSARWLKRAGLEAFANHYPQQSSLGMQRRAALARAFAIRPALMLMDEPFVSLDDATASDLRGLLLELWRSETVTILFVTHDMREAIRLAQRIIVLTPAPARIAADISVPLDDGERADSARIDAFRREHFPAL